jgi:hypothetical protein
MALYDEIRTEIVTELLRVSESKTFKRKTKLRDLLPKYVAVLRESREKEFEAGFDFLKLAPADDDDTLRKRRDALSESFKEYYKKEGKQSRLVLRLSDDDNKDVRLYYEEKPHDDEKATVLQSEVKVKKPRAATEKEVLEGTVIYEADVRKTLKNDFMFNALFLILVIGIWILVIVLPVISLKYLARGAILAGALSAAIALTLLIMSLRLLRLYGTRFTFLIGKLFMMMTKQEVTIASYSSICPICGDTVQLENDRLFRNIGKCQQNPVRHRFSFDHATRKGELIR